MKRQHIVLTKGTQSKKVYVAEDNYIILSNRQDCERGKKKISVFQECFVSGKD